MFPPCPQTAANPQGAQSWANTEGQNFIADHTSPDIDFMSIHLWINNWWVAAALGGSTRTLRPPHAASLLDWQLWAALCQRALIGMRGSSTGHHSLHFFSLPRL